MSRQMLSLFAVPVILIVVAIPLALRQVPRNWFYGFRTAYTLSSDEVWFRANQIAGVALVIAGGIWVCLGLILPAVMVSFPSAVVTVRLLGMGLLAIALAVSFWLTYRK